MKRIITLLMLLLVYQFATAQSSKKMNQNSEFTISDRFSIIHKKAIKKGINRYATANYTVSNLSKTTFSNNITLDSLTTQDWDDNLNQWKPGIREQFTYNTDDRINEAILSIWNSMTSNWQVFQKDEFTYDTNGNLILQITFYQFTPNIWTLANKTEFTYNGDNNLTLEEVFVWDNMGGIWLNTYKYELTYDTNQNLTLDIGYEWLSNQWTNSYKDEYFYTNNILSSEINSLWNYGTDQWDYSNQRLYTFNAGQLITEVVQEWDTNIWVNLNKDDYTYSNNRLDVNVFSIWDNNMNQWVFKYMDNYQYDGNGNRTVGVYSEWLGNPAEWVEDRKDEFVYDLNYNLVDIIYPFFYETTLDDENASANNMVIGYLGFEKENMVWVDDDKMLFFYSNYSNPLRINDFPMNNSLKVYPNPSSHMLVIESDTSIDKVEIYSILGKKVKEIQSDFKRVPIYDIANGVYIVKITSGAQSMSKRIVKQ